jgi:tRNA dimethylallyltransferase
LWSKRKVPILAGGTHYWLQYLLWGDESSSDSNAPCTVPAEIAPWQHDSAALYEKLKLVDPSAAERWHPKDSRRVLRALCKAMSGGAQAAPALNSIRYRALIFWMHTESAMLHDRLNARVDKMMDLGLLHEVTALHQAITAQSTQFDQETLQRGLFQAIGYKELLPYLNALSSDAAAPAPHSATGDIPAACHAGVSPLEASPEQVQSLGEPVQ